MVSLFLFGFLAFLGETQQNLFGSRKIKKDYWCVRILYINTPGPNCEIKSGGENVHLRIRTKESSFKNSFKNPLPSGSWGKMKDMDFNIWIWNHPCFESSQRYDSCFMFFPSCICCLHTIPHTAQPLTSPIKDNPSRSAPLSSTKGKSGSAILTRFRRICCQRPVRSWWPKYYDGNLPRNFPEKMCWSKAGRSTKSLPIWWDFWYPFSLSAPFIAPFRWHQPNFRPGTTRHPQ